MQLRNPWGTHEWKGKWSDKDPNWEKVSKKEKERLSYEKNNNNGIFFMPYEDFLKEFSKIYLAEVDDNASYMY